MSVKTRVLLGDLWCPKDDDFTIPDGPSDDELEAEGAARTDMELLRLRSIIAQRSPKSSEK